MKTFYGFLENLNEETFIQQVAETIVNNNINLEKYLEKNYPSLSLYTEDFWGRTGDTFKNLAGNISAGYKANIGRDVEQMKSYLRNWMQNLSPYDDSGKLRQAAKSALQSIRTIEDDPKLIQTIKQNYISGNRVTPRFQSTSTQPTPPTQPTTAQPTNQPPFTSQIDTTGASAQYNQWQAEENKRRAAEEARQKALANLRANPTTSVNTSDYDIVNKIDRRRKGAKGQIPSPYSQSINVGGW
jgi:hypothetical protein